MKDLTEAELIEIEQRARSLVDTLSPGPEQMRNYSLIETFNAAFDRAEDVAKDVETLCEHARAVSIESQKMENAASRETA